MLATSTRAISQALKDAQLKFPNISADGICAVRDLRQKSIGKIEPGPYFDIAPTFQAIMPDQIATAIEFLSMLEPTKTGRVDSYRLKHVAEDWGRHHDLCGYVSNGALIVAAVALDLVVEPCGPPWSASPNTLVGVSEKSVCRMIAANAFIRRERAKLSPVSLFCSPT